MLNSIFDFILSTDSGLNESIKHSDEYRRLSDESSAIYDKLRKQLNIEQSALLEQFANLSMGAESEASEAYFKEGLKMGVRFAIECLAQS